MRGFLTRTFYFIIVIIASQNSLSEHKGDYIENAQKVNLRSVQAQNRFLHSNSSSNLIANTEARLGHFRHDYITL